MYFCIKVGVFIDKSRDLNQSDIYLGDQNALLYGCSQKGRIFHFLKSNHLDIIASVSDD